MDGELQMNVHFHGKTDVGKKRECNEDSFAIDDRAALTVVCDGMGGHSAGDVASQMAVETMLGVFGEINTDGVNRICEDIQKPLPIVAKRLIASIRLANRSIYNLAIRDKSVAGMGSTIVAAHFYNDHLVVGHVGDSRLYLFRKNQLKQITTDHSWVNELLQDKEISEEEAKDFNKKNVITRALGIKYAVKIDLQIFPVEAGDLFLLCSDGLTGVLSDKQIQKIVQDRGSDLGMLSGELIAAANKGGGPDNITVALAAVESVNGEDKKQITSSITTPEESEEIQILEDKILKQIMGKGKQEDARKRAGWLVVAIPILVAAVLFAVWRFSGIFPLKRNAPGQEMEMASEPATPDSLRQQVPGQTEVTVTPARLFVSSFDNALMEKARIYIDGEFVGNMKQISDLGYEIDPGTHQYEVVYEGKTLQSETLEFAPGMTVSKIVEE